LQSFLAAVTSSVVHGGGIPAARRWKINWRSAARRQ
jgi:hypothetical protein